MLYLLSGNKRDSGLLKAIIKYDKNGEKRGKILIGRVTFLNGGG